MSELDPIFTIKTASEDQIREHLGSCDLLFEPPLYSYVEIGSYAHKIANHAMSFEAWDGETLVGLVAAYYNDQTSRKGFITSVSVLKDFQKRGIAGRLLRAAIDYGAAAGFKSIALELYNNNTAALALYAKYGFAVADRSGEKWTLELPL